jgi:hypothetical protein
VLGTMAGAQVFQVIHKWDILRFGSAQEVILDRVCAKNVNLTVPRIFLSKDILLISKGYLDWTIGAVKIPISSA